MIFKTEKYICDICNEPRPKRDLSLFREEYRLQYSGKKMYDDEFHICSQCLNEIRNRMRDKCKAKKMTNYEKIKAMSVEEMAELLDSFSSCGRCRRNGNNCFPTFNTQTWLESEVDEG